MTNSSLWKTVSLLGRRNTLRSLSNISEGCPPGFVFWPGYFTNEEQRVLLEASLYKLDSLESRRARKKRRQYWDTNPSKLTGSTNLLEVFAPDELYEFEEARSYQLSFLAHSLTAYMHTQGHYDGVIHHFREMHLSSWPVEEFKGLKPILGRLYSLCPTPAVQTHLLHLASHGYILPHVDNIESSGSWILGVSLGAERILRIQKADNSTEEAQYSIPLPSGSIYLQR